jgi:hypothetical protein
VKVPEIQEAMRTMAMEMERVRVTASHSGVFCSKLLPASLQAGMISDMMDDAIDTATGEGVDEAADEEIERVVAEVTAGQFGTLSSAPTGRVVVVRRFLVLFVGLASHEWSLACAVCSLLQRRPLPRLSPHALRLQPAVVTEIPDWMS